MPSHMNCCVPGCTNENISVSGAFSRMEKVNLPSVVFVELMGKVDVETRLMFAMESFHRLPADKHLRSDWLVKIRRINTPRTANTYVCGVHCEGGRRKGVTSSPTILSWSAKAKARTTRVSAAATDLSHLVDKENDERHPSSSVGDCRVPSLASEPEADDSTRTSLKASLHVRRLAPALPRIHSSTTGGSKWSSCRINTIKYLANSWRRREALSA